MYKKYQQLSKLFLNGQKNKVDIEELFEIYIKLFSNKIDSNILNQTDELKKTFNAKSMFNLLNLSYKDYINQKNKQKILKSNDESLDDTTTKDTHLYESS